MSTTSASAKFLSLTELRAEHDRLQRDLKTESAVVAASEVVNEFIRRAVLTGTRLDAKEDRKSAQAVINYWVSRVSAANAGNRGSQLDSDLNVDSLLEEFETTTLSEALDAANQWIEQDLNADDRALVRRILIRFVRLREDQSVESLPISRFSLNDLEPRDRVEALLDRLQNLGITQITTRSNGIEEVGLRSDSFIEGWEFLKSLIEERKKLRKAANEWKLSRSRSGSQSGGLRRFARRQLMSLGKRMDQGWEKIIRLFGGKVIVVQDPAEQFPDVDFYRDRNQSEIDYLFQRRTLSKESKEWMRVVKGLAVVTVLLIATIVAVVLVKRHLEINELESQKKIAVANASEKAKDNEIKARRARQRLKEQINLVRLLAQHQQYDNLRDYPRAQIAKWRIETPFQGMDANDLQDYQNELREIGIVFDVKDAGICATCSDSPLDVARKLKGLIHSRTSDPQSANFDKDTLTYRDNLSRMWYTAAENLVVEICRVLEEKGSKERPHNYDAFAGYMDEFWVLYHGEMAIVETHEVERLMVNFGEGLKDVDRHFHQKLNEKMAAIPGATRLDVKINKNANAATSAYLWKSANKGGQLEDTLSSFLQQPLQDLQRSWGESDRRGIQNAVKALKVKRDQLLSQIRKELN